jgi:hypothetical protein
VAAPLEKYQIPSGNYRYRFYLRPFKKGKKSMIDVVRKVK